MNRLRPPMWRPPTSSVMLNGWYLGPFQRVTTFARCIMKYFHKAVTLV